MGGWVGVPVAVWEMSLAVWMIAKGSRRSPAAAGPDPAPIAHAVLP